MRQRSLFTVCLLLVGSGLAGLSAQNASGPAPRAAAPSSRFELAVDSIMRGPKLVGYPPQGLRWSGDSARLYFEWRRPGEDEPSTYVVDRDGSGLRKLTDQERKLAPSANGVWDRAHRRVLFVDDGDIVLLDTVARSRQQITKTSTAEANPRWAKDETAVSFTLADNLYIVPLGSGSIQQVTNVHPRKRDSRETDSQKVLKQEEQSLIEFTREAAEKKKKQEEKKKRDALPEFELQDRQAVPDLSLSVDGRHVYMIVVDRAEGSKTAEVPNYVTESAYVESIQARAMVGDAQNRRRLAILDLQSGKTIWAESAFAGTRAPRATSAAAATPGSQADVKPQPREVQWNMPLPSKDGRYAVASVRSADFKDRWIVIVDPETGKNRTLDALHDDAWVREIGGGNASLGWMPDDRRVWFLSERDGWMHLYTVDASESGARPQQVTTGKFELTSVELAPDKSRFYLTSTEAHPGERHVYEMALTGGMRTRLTSMTGSNAAEISPAGATLGLIYSSATKPPEVYVMPNKSGGAARQVTTTPTEAWRSFNWIDPRLITFKARDGVDVYARLYTPEMINAARDPVRPGVVFVHGSGYLQNAHKYWSSYYHEYMFHNLLASKGYVVLDVDYRASAGYGRDWRTAIYRHMGGKDLDDIVDGAKYLVAEQKVDPRRLGVYGGSYGGFITLMAMFTSPDTFAAGAALRPVTDWAHYNHGYTAAILNEPQEDQEAYRRSSPIYFAQGLKGALLICHGMVDTNVMFQDSVRLAQRLIELRKENWELAAFPVENHGFEQETSWADEYRRILKLFENNLRKNGQSN